MNPRFLTFALLLVGGMLLPGRLNAQVQAGEDTGPDTVVYTPERGKVTFTHRKHAEQAKCEACHHESRAEKPLESPRQKCSACHTEPAVQPMKTSRGLAMHDTDNEEGVCVTCHLKEEEAGKEVPVKCSSCHKREGDPGSAQLAKAERSRPHLPLSGARKAAGTVRLGLPAPAS